MINGEEIKNWFVEVVRCLTKSDLENKVLSHLLMTEIFYRQEDLAVAVLSFSSLMKVSFLGVEKLGFFEYEKYYQEYGT